MRLEWWHGTQRVEGETVMKSIARRIARLEERALRQRQEAEPSPAEILLERRRKHALAEGREPEPDREFRVHLDGKGRRLSLADILLMGRRRSDAVPGL